MDIHEHLSEVMCGVPMLKAFYLIVVAAYRLLRREIELFAKKSRRKLCSNENVSSVACPSLQLFLLLIAT